MDKKNLTFNINQAEADLIVRALGELPYKTSFALITNLQNQYQIQTAESKPEAKKNEDENPKLTKTD